MEGRYVSSVSNQTGV